MKTVLFKRVWPGLAVVMVLSGCGATPEAPTPDQRQQAAQTQVESIQNNPNMSPEAKQRAIEGIRSQQSR